MVSMFLCVHVHSRFSQSASARATFCSSQEAQTPTQFGIQPPDELSNTSAALNASLSRVTEPRRSALLLSRPVAFEEDGHAVDPWRSHGAPRLPRSAKAGRS